MKKLLFEDMQRIIPETVDQVILPQSFQRDLPHVMRAVMPHVKPELIGYTIGLVVAVGREAIKLLHLVH